jgi:hypothetical protein
MIFKIFILLCSSFVSHFVLPSISPFVHLPQPHPPPAFGAYTLPIIGLDKLTERPPRVPVETLGALIVLVANASLGSCLLLKFIINFIFYIIYKILLFYIFILFF